MNRTSRREDPRAHRMRTTAALLIAAAAIVFVVPWPHRVMSSAGTTDGRTVDSVGESRSLRVAAVAPPAVRRGDDAVAALVRSHQAAEINRQAANRLLLCLVLTAPGAYCLGAARRQAGAPATD